ncbi:NAD(P)-binding protein [Pleurostoma richardsiae]|uniref:NAD(P)-binding protein n=1 Tax=Pleurostoma richardsiae TaxID=41990 RepID=A0AA38VUJ1_9PEZI|nr:NAD(P)-binding protein [Pleurostoma richardsiae]
MSAAKKLVVCGGNGFLGSRICKHAVSRGWDVTSISRSGEPKWQTVTSSSSPPAWAHKVTWERADVFQPATYAPLLKGANYVVHSLGILLEADYKGVLQGRESPISGLRKAFSPAKSQAAAPNPLERGSGEGVNPPKSAQQLTYELMNRDSAVLLARAAAEEKVGAFAYVSAYGGAPVLPARYISTKREAESIIAREFPEMRGVFLRPPFMYDSSRPLTLPLAAGTAVGSFFNGLTGGALGSFMGTAGVKPLKVEVVAEATVEALNEEAVRGPVEIAQIEELADKAWRKTML